MTTKTGEAILAAATLGEAHKLAREFDPEMHATALLNHWIFLRGAKAPMTQERRMALQPLLFLRITQGPDKQWYYRGTREGVTQIPRGVAAPVTVKKGSRCSCS